ncbi:UDP-galactopyranose/dTDP-fucopyranose mutase family protein [Frigidibacter oleivorans]|uniref:UDP-galactopyranose/dTDP-fucopyranose mutase family protein n=1 Tax=Frigidibacter oleivorans TaxID=2487129 RepID=UPI000F8E725E|nr:UDP-galactopyranose mutase [Frigidibacter oleivorans]
MNDRLLIVGAGLSGAVIARTLAEAGRPSTVIEARDHPGGNCHTARDEATGVMVHVHGPHIFHTDDAEAWALVNRFASFRPYRNRVKTTAAGAVYSMPINLHTINQFFGRTFAPGEARQFIAARAEPATAPARSFEDQALQMIGRDLYETFLRGYTLKQWGRPPAELPAAILRRLPLRFDYDDNYFAHRFQGIPEEGYTAMIARMLDHPLIGLELGCPFRPGMAADFGHVFYSGPLDAWFGCDLGPLGYRTLDFERIEAQGDFQGCAVMNYGDADVPWTRITEHKHFAPWERHEATVCHREYSRAAGPGDLPYYPVRLVEETALLTRYAGRAAELEGVTFVGRLGTYRYLDMDVTVREALDTAQAFLAARRDRRPMPSFLRAPL